MTRWERVCNVVMLEMLVDNVLVAPIIVGCGFSLYLIVRRASKLQKVGGVIGAALWLGLVPSLIRNHWDADIWIIMVTTFLASLVGGGVANTLGSMRKNKQDD